MNRSRSSVASPPDPGLLIDALVQSSFTTMAVLTKVAAENDLSLTQLRVLAILRDRHVGVTALAQHLGLEKSTMSGLVERAEKRELVKRVPSDDDGRGVHVSITSKGKGLAKRVYAQVEQSLLPMMSALSGTERARLHELLVRMLGSVEPK